MEHGGKLKTFFLFHASASMGWGSQHYTVLNKSILDSDRPINGPGQKGNFLLFHNI